MAKKIITPPREDWKKNRTIYTRTCPECGTKFSYDWTDTIQSNWTGGYVAVLCPTCQYPVAHIIGGGGADINKPEIEM